MNKSNPIQHLPVTSRQDVEIIDLDSDELGEFGALATCVDDEPDLNVVQHIPLQKRINIAIDAVNKKGEPSQIASRYNVSVDSVYACAAELILAGKHALEKQVRIQSGEQGPRSGAEH